MSKEFTLKVNGVELKNDTLYQVIPKIDHDAPDGFREHGTTKILSPRVSETVSCIFNQRANVWDTGFFVNSPCYRGMTPEASEVIVETLQEHIVKPVERMLGEGKLIHVEENTFWDNLMINLRNGGVFNTANPIELFHLYIAILHSNLAPKDQENEHRFKKAKYCIVNKEEVINVRQKREADKNKAIGLFYNLFNVDKKKLMLIFDYVNIHGITETTPEITANAMFNQFITDKQEGYQNIELFLKAEEKARDNDGLREMTVYKDLKELFRKGIIIKQYSEFFLDGESLGTNFVDATQKVMSDKALETKVFELVQ